MIVRSCLFVKCQESIEICFCVGVFMWSASDLTCAVAVVDSDVVIGAGGGLNVKGVKLHLHLVTCWCLHR